MVAPGKGLIFDSKRFAVHDGPGIRTTLFFKGCPLRCIWCHNPEGIDAGQIETEKIIRLNGRDFSRKEWVGKEYTVDELFVETMKDLPFWEESGGGVTLSGGEPLLQPLFALEVIKAFKHKGIHVALDTCGHAPESIIKQFTGVADLFLFDLKLVDEKKHQMVTGVSNRLILNNLNLLIDHKAAIRVRIPVIPGINFNNNDLSDFINLLAPLQTNILGVDLLPYHSIAAHKYQRFNIENKMSSATSLAKDELNGWKSRFETFGFEVKIGG